MNQQYKALLDCASEGGGLPISSIAIWDFLFDCQHQFEISGDMMEIGVWHGVGVAAMALNAQSGEETAGIDLRIQNEQVQANFKKIFGSSTPRIKFHEGNSITLRKKHHLANKSASLRWIHIDGEHSYNGVRSDLDWAAGLLCEGGIIVVDDFFNISSACVTQAVYDAVSQNGHHYRMFLAGENKAYLSTPQYFGRYRQMCQQSLVQASEKKFDVKFTLAQNGHSTEIDYYTIFERYQDYKGMQIGRWLKDGPPSMG